MRLKIATEPYQEGDYRIEFDPLLGNFDVHRRIDGYTYHYWVYVGCRKTRWGARRLVKQLIKNSKKEYYRV